MVATWIALVLGWLALIASWNTENPYATSLGIAAAVLFAFATVYGVRTQLRHRREERS